MNDENKKVALEKAVKLLNDKGLVKITKSTFTFDAIARTWCQAELSTDFLISDGSDGSDPLRVTHISIGLSNELFSTELNWQVIALDSAVHSDHIKDLELRIVLRIAYLIYKAVRAADTTEHCNDFNARMNLVRISDVYWSI